MILRSNKKLLDSYLTEFSNQVSVLSVHSAQTHLLTFLGFLGEIPLENCTEAAKAYKAFLYSDISRRDGKNESLSAAYIRKNLSAVRAFLIWMRDEKNTPGLTESWLNRNLRVTAKESNLAAQKPKDEGAVYFSVDELVQIARTPADTLAEERIRAACIFLLLSGMRITAFLTMPIVAVDLDSRKVKQWTALGVRTKLSKSATTTLIQISKYPELFDVVRAWDTKVRKTLPETFMWFANISSLTGEIDRNPNVGRYRSSGFRDDLIKFLEKAGVPYKSAHKFRHGHIRFLRSRAKNMLELEAIANNAMQNINTMLKYGALGNNESRAIVDTLCEDDSAHPGESTKANITQIIPDIERLLEQIKRLSGGEEEGVPCLKA